jgi:hypothetical protein
MTTVTSKSDYLEQEIRYEAYGLNLPCDRPFPAKLQSFIDNVIKKERPWPPSPKAAELRNMRLWLEDQNEDTAKGKMVDKLLFKGEEEPTGIKGIECKSNLFLARQYLPEPLPTFKRYNLADLEQAQPDTTLGYILATWAKRYKFESPFTQAEDLKLLPTSISRALLFPFLTAQWKSAAKGQTHKQAQPQLMRDGACVVNYLTCFYREAGEKAPDVMKTSHFSLCCDTRSAELWVHWQETENDHEVYYMELVDVAPLWKQSMLEDMRRYLHNILDYALNERIQSIKEAMPKIAPDGTPSLIPNGLASTELDTTIDPETSQSNRPAPLSAASNSNKGPKTPISKQRTVPSAASSNTNKGLKTPTPKKRTAPSSASSNTNKGPKTPTPKRPRTVGQ